MNKIEEVDSSIIPFQNLTMFAALVTVRNLVNIKNMTYYSCLECDKEIYCQSHRMEREEVLCEECFREKY